MHYCCERVHSKDLENGVHLCGIGGVGMTALAEMLLDLNISVTGSDTKFSANVLKLRERGVKIYASHKREHALNKLVCRTRAVKDDNEEVHFAEKVVFRSTLLAYLAKGKKQLVVTGAHGKTTVSALLSHCMLECGYDISYAVGGFSKSLGRYGKIGGGEYFVLEGDESDGSHLKTEPYGGILTSLDVDHLAFWKNGDNLLESYKKFIENITCPGHFIYNGEDPFLLDKDIPGVSFGMSDLYDYYPENVQLECAQSSFSVKGEKIILPMFGAYNIKNALSVYALLESFGIPCGKIKKAFTSFKGISRRMEYLGKNIYSDYAHHPEEVKSVLKSVKKIAEDTVIIFEPHRVSRFKDELENFISVFHNVIITDIFEASEGLNTDPLPLIERFCKETGSRYVRLDQIEGYLKTEKRKVLALGAGSLDALLREYVGREI
jgi:UDP-N-acetylmuramate--alanine ligase